jgi:hypothetical protein
MPLAWNTVEDAPTRHAKHAVGTPGCAVWVSLYPDAAEGGPRHANLAARIPAVPHDSEEYIVLFRD